MKFFIPAAEDESQAESVISMVQEFTGFSLPTRPIQSLTFVHDGETHTATVGESIDARYDPTGVVVVILEGSNQYAVCTTNRGVVSGGPIHVGQHNVRNAVLFDVKPR